MKQIAAAISLSLALLAVTLAWLSSYNVDAAVIDGEPFYVTNRFSGTAMVCAVGIGCSPSYPQEARFNPPSHGTKLSN